MAKYSHIQTFNLYLIKKKKKNCRSHNTILIRLSNGSEMPTDIEATFRHSTFVLAQYNFYQKEKSDANSDGKWYRVTARSHDLINVTGYLR